MRQGNCVRLATSDNALTSQRDDSLVSECASPFKNIGQLSLTVSSVRDLAISS